MNKLAKKAIELALQSVGVKETSPNWGKWIAYYLRFCGIFRPAPWCACFVAYKIHQAATVLKVTTSWPRKAYVQSVYLWALKQNLVKPKPEPNSVFAVYHPDLNRYAHIGFIVDTHPTAKGIDFLTCEGNSNTTGGREGREVVSTWRRWDPKRHICIRLLG